MSKVETCQARKLVKTRRDIAFIIKLIKSTTGGKWTHVCCISRPQRRNNKIYWKALLMFRSPWSWLWLRLSTLSLINWCKPASAIATPTSILTRLLACSDVSSIAAPAEAETANWVTANTRMDSELYKLMLWMIMQSLIHYQQMFLKAPRHRCEIVPTESNLGVSKISQH